MAGIRLQLKLLIGVLFVGTTIGVTGIYLLVQYERTRLAREVLHMAEITGHSIHYALEGMMLADRGELIEHTLQELKQGSWVEAAAIYDPRGNMWLGTGRRDGRPDATELDAIRRVAGSGQLEIAVDDRDGGAIQVRMPLKNDTQCQRCHGAVQPINGVLELELNPGVLSRMVAGHTRTLAIGSIALLTLVSGTVIVVTRRTIVAPLEGMVTSMERIAAGDYSARVDARRSDELGRIARTFNRMSERIAAHASRLANERELLRHKVDTMFTTSIQALAAALEARDPYTRGHSEFVAEYAVSIGDELSLSPPEKEDLRLAGLLHDIGKLGIRDDVLKGEHRIDVRTEPTVVAHPILGAAIIEKADSLRRLAPLVRHHHERYDGNGYPDALAADAIPFGARILAVADAFEAMTSRRSYREALTRQAAAAQLLEGVGSQFDSVVVRAFVRVLDSGRLDHVIDRTREVRAAMPTPACAAPMLRAIGNTT